MDTKRVVIEVQKTDIFINWVLALRDDEAQARIAARLDRLALGNVGDVKSVGGGVSEMRIDYGPGYRIYFAYRGRTVVILLCGGDKRTQARDIKRAQKMVVELG
jgi:putative addiction module killer protein